jgi:hypothetical protein
MAVRAKFKVNRVERSLMSVRNPDTGNYESREVQTIVLNVVHAGGSPENDRFFAATPGGEIKLSTVNAAAAAAFALGGEVYVDFVPAE